MTLPLNKAKAAALLLAPSFPIAWLAVIGATGLALWLSIQWPAEPRTQTVVLGLGLPALWLSFRSHSLWKVENVSLVPGLPVTLFQLILGIITLFFAVVSIAKLTLGQPLDTVLIHSAISLVLVILGRASHSSFWLLLFAFYINGHYIVQLLGQWSHLPWVQLLFLSGNLVLVYWYYKACTAGWSEYEWHTTDQPRGVSAWVAGNEQRARYLR